MNKLYFFTSEELPDHPHIQNLSQLLLDLRLATRIPILFFVNGEIRGADIPNDVFLPEEIEQPFLSDPSIAHQLYTNAENQPTVQKESDSIYYCTQKYTFEMSDKPSSPEIKEEGASGCAPDIMCILGPLSDKYIAKTDLHAYMRRHHLHNFQNYHIHIASYHEALALISVVTHLITGNMPDTVFHSNPVSQSLALPKDETNLDLFSFQTQNYRSDSRPHFPYLYEQQLLDYIRKGDLESFEKFSSEQLISANANYSIGKIANNDLKQLEYRTVSQIILFARAAIEGGVNPYDAYDISDMLLQKVSSRQTPENYLKVHAECNQKFLSAVKKVHDKESSSRYIEKCKYYISKNLRKPFTIPDIAEYVGLSPNYLGNLFRQHEPCTLKQYIIQERITAAQNMLKYSDYSISDIAHALCFQSQSHFGVLFKKSTGMTPAQFRKVNRPLNF